MALGTSPVVRALFDPEGGMRDVRALDRVSFTDWFKSHGGSQGSIDRMWCATRPSQILAVTSSLMKHYSHAKLARLCLFRHALWRSQAAAGGRGSLVSDVEVHVYA